MPLQDSFGAVLGKGLYLQPGFTNSFLYTSPVLESRRSSVPCLPAGSKMDKHATTILLVPTWANRRSGTQKSDPWSIDCRQQVACVEWKTAPQLLQWKGVGRTISSILIQMSRLPIPEATKKPTATEEERVP